MNSNTKNSPHKIDLRNDQVYEYTNSFGFEWIKHAKTQLDSYTGLPISRNRLFGVTGWPEKMKGQRILEAGSGAGRFTEVLLHTDAEIWSFDSSEAVEANRLNNGGFSNLHLFRTDIMNLPSNIGLFDKVLCLGVLQHTSDPRTHFLKLAKFVRPGGEIVIDVYKQTITARLQWKYFLRPLTKHLPSRFLYVIIAKITPPLLPLARWARKWLGSAGARFLPIVEYSYLGLPSALNQEWAILDTFDMYSPAYDRPQTVSSVQKWFKEAGFQDIEVCYGPNGIIGKGKRPH